VGAEGAADGKSYGFMFQRSFLPEIIMDQVLAAYDTAFVEWPGLR
jgi:hypothetical protein